MTEQQIDILVLIIGLPLVGIGLYLWAKAARHMFGLLTNFKPDMTWGRFIPVCIFMPNLFTEKGNIHRVALLKYAGLFILFFGTPMVVVGLWQVFSR